MYWQHQVYRTGQTWGVGGTYREFLPEQGLLSAIMLHVYGTPVNDARIATEKWRIMDYISEFRIVANGSEVLHHLNGRMEHYNAWMRGAPAMADQHHNYATSKLRGHFTIPFGRWPYDPYYGLDLSAFNSVELQFKNDVEAAQFASGFEIDVMLVLLQRAQARQFSHHIRTEEFRRWTTVQAATEYIDLPTKGKLAHVLMQVDPDMDANNSAEDTLYNTLYNIKCTLQSGKEEVYNGSLRDLWYANANWYWRQPIVGVESYHTDAKGIRTGLGQTFYKAGAYLSHDGGQSDYAPDYVPGDDSSTQRRQSDGDGDQWSGLFAGLSMENCARLDFDIENDPASWLDLDLEKVVELECKTKDAASAADGTVVVALDRLFAN